ncbi:helix-turn-helix domain-containing protein [Deinococcus humi]|uniref:Transcriptional regulator with XRE-family HTH domain n=1 Tax=Deinococcus humi TaxID=662880 RepID=A0A7W8NG18_9DEIO|nr:helix-turn-helix transcriptional regulator [Deinococcus humi]MBB5362507.1 transcriptional regulator with XRE-family HTH domain [Deinococcus humi]GGO28466.1 hypothetical protein GCM10008949_21140 [Deinococcus humi]
MDVNERIRARVRAEMVQQNLTQIELARRLGISPPALSQIMSGRRGTMPESLMNVLEALGLTLEAVPKKDG